MASKLFIVSAPSGAGKTTLVEAVLKRLQPRHALERVVTYTTKEPRQGEIPGVDYHFVSVNQFQQKLQEGFFLEYSTRYGTYYGSPKSMVTRLSEGVSSIVVIDRVGAQAISALHETVRIWIGVPSIEELQKRLEARNRENPEQIQKRLKLAAEELAQEEAEMFYHHHVMNDAFERAIACLHDIIVQEIEREFEPVVQKEELL